MRPPGLWTAVVVLATEFLRSRVAADARAELPGRVDAGRGHHAGMMLAYRVVLGVCLRAAGAFRLCHRAGAVVDHALYPIVVALSRLVLDLRKPATGEVDSFGRRM